MLSLKAFLGLDASGFEVGINKAQKKAESFSQSVQKRIGQAFSIATVMAWFNRTSQMFDDLEERAKKIKLGSLETGLDIGMSQRFFNTLEATGVNANAGANALEKLAEATQKIKKGEDTGGKLAASMAVFGVAMDDIQKKDYRQIFFQISDAMKRMAVDARSLGALSDLLGGKSGDLVPAMKIGFDSKASTLGALSEAEIAQIEKLAKTGKEGAQFWKDWGNEIAIWAKKWAIGITSGPEVLRGIFKKPEIGVNTVQEDRLNKEKQEKANREQAAAKSAADAQKIREGFLKRRGEFEEQMAAERFSLLSNEQKLQVLKAQAQVLKDMREGLEASVRNDGDPTGEREAKIAELKLMQLKNRGAQQELREQPYAMSPFVSQAANINSIQQIGARVGFTPLQSAIQQNTAAIRDNTNSRRSLPIGQSGGAEY